MIKIDDGSLHWRDLGSVQSVAAETMWLSAETTTDGTGRLSYTVGHCDAPAVLPSLVRRPSFLRELQLEQWLWESPSILKWLSGMTSEKVYRQPGFRGKSLEICDLVFDSPAQRRAVFLEIKKERGTPACEQVFRQVEAASLEGSLPDDYLVEVFTLSWNRPTWPKLPARVSSATTLLYRTYSHQEKLLISLNRGSLQPVACGGPSIPKESGPWAVLGEQDRVKVSASHLHVLLPTGLDRRPAIILETSRSQQEYDWWKKEAPPVWECLRQAGAICWQPLQWQAIDPPKLIFYLEPEVDPAKAWVSAGITQQNG
jgi:hypothetical protein